MLELRIRRLDGLILLRDVQAKYEQATGIALQNPNDLISKGYLAAFPLDPLNLGYIFSDGVFAMEEVGISGVTRPQK